MVADLLCDVVLNALVDGSDGGGIFVAACVVGG